MIAADLEAVFTVVFLGLGIPLIVAELVGVWRKRRGDTISEHYWWVQKRWPVATRLLMGFFLGWLFVHFLFGPNVDETSCQDENSAVAVAQLQMIRNGTATDEDIAQTLPFDDCDGSGGIDRADFEGD